MYLQIGDFVLCYLFFYFVCVVVILQVFFCQMWMYSVNIQFQFVIVYLFMFCKFIVYVGFCFMEYIMDLGVRQYYDVIVVGYYDIVWLYKLICVYYWDVN